MANSFVRSLALGLRIGQLSILNGYKGLSGRKKENE
jgi:hypothetical protein